MIFLSLIIKQSSSLVKLRLALLHSILPANIILLLIIQNV